MPLKRIEDQLVEGELQRQLLASQSVAAGTWHLAKDTGPIQSGSVFQPGVQIVAGAPAFPDVVASAGKFAQLVVDITNVGGAGTLTVTIFGMDQTSGKIYPILVSAALAAVATTVLRVGPGLVAAAGLTANDFLPLSWNVQLVVAANAVAFSLGILQMP